MAMIAVLGEILRRPTLGDNSWLMGPIWVAVFIGILVGWAWKPKWAKHLGKELLDCSKMCNSLETRVALKFRLPSWGTSETKECAIAEEVSSLRNSWSYKCRLMGNLLMLSPMRI